MTAVDKFMKTNKRLYEPENNFEMSSVWRALDADEYDDYYGVDTTFIRASVRNDAYRKMYNQEINVIYECPCKATKKHRHHFDYDRPCDILLLCIPCHRKEHARLNQSQAAMTAHDSSTVAPSESSLTAVISQDRATQKQYSSSVELPNLATAYVENERSASSLIAVTDLQTGIGGIGG